MDRGIGERQEPGGREVIEELLLQPLLLSYARHLSRDINLGHLLDIDKVDFFVAGVIRYLEAVYALAPPRAHRPTQAHLGKNDPCHQRDRQ